MHKNSRKTAYVVKSSKIFWQFLNGYSCNAVDENHFIRHIGHRFSTICDMYTLNNACKSGEIGIYILKTRPSNPTYNKISVEKPNIVDRYLDDFGYVLEINHGSLADEDIKKRLFASEDEATEWENSYGR